MLHFAACLLKKTGRSGLATSPHAKQHPYILFLLILSLMLIPLPSVRARGDTEAAINDLLNNMETAVRAGDRETYLSYVDQSDPVFALEHQRWADDWTDLHPVEKFDLKIENLDIGEDEATGDLTMMWSLKDNPQNQRAEFRAQFRLGPDSTWLYAGEWWATVTTYDHFIVRAAAGLDEVAEQIGEMLPGVYALTTDSLEYEPDHVIEIKLYNQPEALVANTLLSLPIISGWNEPGESLKLVTGASIDRKRIRFVLAHELTHQLTFDMAGDSHGAFPWWTEEGLAQYVASQLWSEAEQDDYLRQTQSAAEVSDLADWAEITDFNTTPLDLWRYVYPQGYAFVRFVTEQYGEDERNEWIDDMAANEGINEASEDAFNHTFAELDQEFEGWLAR